VSLGRKTIIVKAVLCSQEDVYGSFENITLQIKVAYLGPTIRSLLRCPENKEAKSNVNRIKQVYV
jgi:hypothetical protein